MEEEGTPSDRHRAVIAPGRRALVLAGLGALGGLVMGLAVGCSGDDGAAVSAGGSSSTAVSASSTSTEAPTKVPVSVSRLAQSVASARQGGTADLSGLSTPFLHVRADGKIELVLRVREPVTAAQQTELTALGAEVVGAVSGTTVQVWVPDDKIEHVGALPWVVSVSPPSYSRVGG